MDKGKTFRSCALLPSSARHAVVIAVVLHAGNVDEVIRHELKDRVELTASVLDGKNTAVLDVASDLFENALIEAQSVATVESYWYISET